jgi:hypothetical protein
MISNWVLSQDRAERPPERGIRVLSRDARLTLRAIRAGKTIRKTRLTCCFVLQLDFYLFPMTEAVLEAGGEHDSPEWLEWFRPVRLSAFKANTQLKAGHLPQARETLLGVLDELEAGGEKQRTVVLADLAAVETEAGHPEEACEYARRALDQLERTWYATGMERIRDVRRALTPHQHERCVQELDDRVYGWSTTVSALAR